MQTLIIITEKEFQYLLKKHFAVVVQVTSWDYFGL